MYKYIISFIFIIFIVSCSFHIDKSKLNPNMKIFIEEQAIYYPDGYGGITSTDYNGAIALVDSTIIFDGGFSSKPWVQNMNRFLEIPVMSIQKLK